MGSRPDSGTDVRVATLQLFAKPRFGQGAIAPLKIHTVRVLCHLLSIVASLYPIITILCLQKG